MAVPRTRKICRGRATVKDIGGNPPSDRGKAVELETDIADTLFGLALCQGIPESDRDSAGHFLKAMDLEPKMGNFRICRGFASKSVHLYEAALTDMKQAVKPETANESAGANRV